MNMEQPKQYPSTGGQSLRGSHAHYFEAFKHGNYNNSTSLQIPITSPIFVQAPSEKGFSGFAVDFAMGGVSAAVSKTAAAPIERVKILIQNQDEMIKSGRLSEPYKGIGDCFKRTIRDEGFGSLWRGNGTNVLRYFPTQVSFIRIFYCMLCRICK